MYRPIFFTAALALSVCLSACPDPAANKPKAKVGEATTAPTSTETPTPDTPETSTSDAPETVTLTISPDSKIEFVGSKVTGKHEGGFKEFSGTIELVANDPTKSKVSIEIDTKSVYSDADGLTQHLMTEDFFHVEKFPKATFVSTEIKTGGESGATHTVTGNLELRGETKSITFPATINVEGDTVTAKSEFSINRKDFKIEYAGMPDDLIRDDVLIKLDITAKKQ